MTNAAFTLLRVTLGAFLVVWGGDKLVNPDHAVAVSEGFYGGLVSASFLVTIGGVVEIALGVLVILGRYRTISYTGLLLVATATLIGVWKSILDPLGLFMEGGNPVFFSSAIIWAASFYLWTQRGERTGAS